MSQPHPGENTVTRVVQVIQLLVAETSPVQAATQLTNQEALTETTEGWRETHENSGAGDMIAQL